jgi:hypothetical protein
MMPTIGWPFESCAILMVHEYFDRAETLHMALYAAHAQVGMLAKTVEQFKFRTENLLT